MQTKSSYIFSADFIRAIAILGVVIIHTTNAVYTRPDFFGGSVWWITILLDSLSRISIPLFIMLSGFLILRKDETLQQSIKRIFSRIAIPLIFWLVFYMWYGGGIPSISFINSSIFSKLFSGDVYHLYYLIILIGLYFVAPFVRSYLNNVSSRAQDFFMKILLLLGIAEVALQYVFQACGTENSFTKWVPYTGLFVAGYVLGTRKSTLSKNIILGIYLFSLIATIAFNYINANLLFHNITILSPTGCLSHYTDYYLSLNVVAMSICAFVLLLQAKYLTLQKAVFISPLIKSIAKAAFGIYLIHPFIARVLEVQFHLAVDFSTLPLAVIIFLKVVLVFIISYVVSIMGSKIPVVKLVFGGK